MEFQRDYFSHSYIDARHKFLLAAQDCGGEIETHINSSAGQFDGQPLATDIYYLGPKIPRRILLISSGVHGVEGYCGSAVQTGLLKSGILHRLHNDTGLLLVHALNPYGFAYDRRVTENNVDLNRNFIDFSTSLADDAEYKKTRDQIYPDSWTGSDGDTIEDRVKECILKLGIAAFQKSITCGQHEYPDDPFFVGTEPAWSRKVWEAIVDKVLSYTDLVVHLDIHSGLGSSGELERILPVHNKSVSYQRAAKWYGEHNLRCPAFSTSNSPHVEGDLPSVLRNLCPSAVTLGLEFGTVDLDEMLFSVIADNWLSFNMDTELERRNEIKVRIKNAFYVDTDEWKKSVWIQSCDIVAQSLRGLCAL